MEIIYNFLLLMAGIAFLVFAILASVSMYVDKFTIKGVSLSLCLSTLSFLLIFLSVK